MKLVFLILLLFSISCSKSKTNKYDTPSEANTAAYHEDLYVSESTFDNISYNKDSIFSVDVFEKKLPEIILDPNLVSSDAFVKDFNNYLGTIKNIKETILYSTVLPKCAIEDCLWLKTFLPNQKISDIFYEISQKHYNDNEMVKSANFILLSLDTAASVVPMKSILLTLDLYMYKPTLFKDSVVNDNFFATYFNFVKDNKESIYFESVKKVMLLIKDNKSNMSKRLKGVFLNLYLNIEADHDQLYKTIVEDGFYSDYLDTLGVPIHWKLADGLTPVHFDKQLNKFKLLFYLKTEFLKENLDLNSMQIFINKLEVNSSLMLEVSKWLQKLKFISVSFTTSLHFSESIDNILPNINKNFFSNLETYERELYPLWDSLKLFSDELETLYNLVEHSDDIMSNAFAQLNSSLNINFSRYVLVPNMLLIFDRISNHFPEGGIRYNKEILLKPHFFFKFLSAFKPVWFNYYKNIQYTPIDLINSINYLSKTNIHDMYNVDLRKLISNIEKTVFGHYNTIIVDDISFLNQSYFLGSSKAQQYFSWCADVKDGKLNNQGETLNFEKLIFKTTGWDHNPSNQIENYKDFISFYSENRFKNNDPLSTSASATDHMNSHIIYQQKDARGLFVETRNIISRPDWNLVDRLEVVRSEINRASVFFEQIVLSYEESFNDKYSMSIFESLTFNVRKYLGLILNVHERAEDCVKVHLNEEKRRVNGILAMETRYLTYIFNLVDGIKDGNISLEQANDKLRFEYRSLVDDSSLIYSVDTHIVINNGSYFLRYDKNEVITRISNYLKTGFVLNDEETMPALVGSKLDIVYPEKLKSVFTSGFSVSSGAHNQEKLPVAQDTVALVSINDDLNSFIKTSLSYFSIVPNTNKAKPSLALTNFLDWSSRSRLGYLLQSSRNISLVNYHIEYMSPFIYLPYNSSCTFDSQTASCFDERESNIKSLYSKSIESFSHNDLSSMDLSSMSSIGQPLLFKSTHNLDFIYQLKPSLDIKPNETNFLASTYPSDEMAGFLDFYFLIHEKDYVDRSTNYPSQVSSVKRLDYWFSDKQYVNLAANSLMKMKPYYFGNNELILERYFDSIDLVYNKYFGFYENLHNLSITSISGTSVEETLKMVTTSLNRDDLVEVNPSSASGYVYYFYRDSQNAPLPVYPLNPRYQNKYVHAIDEFTLNHSGVLKSGFDNFVLGLVE